MKVRLDKTHKMPEIALCICGRRWHLMVLPNDPDYKVVEILEKEILAHIAGQEPPEPTFGKGVMQFEVCSSCADEKDEAWYAARPDFNVEYDGATEMQSKIDLAIRHTARPLKLTPVMTEWGYMVCPFVGGYQHAMSERRVAEKAPRLYLLKSEQMTECAETPDGAACELPSWVDADMIIDPTDLVA